MQLAEKQIYRIGLALLMFISIALFVERCGNKKALFSAQYELGEANTSLGIYRDATGNFIEYKRIINLENEKQVKGLKEELAAEKIKKPQVVVHYHSVFKVDTIHHAFTDTLPCDNFMEPFAVDSGYLKFEGFVTNKTLNIYNLEIPNDLTLIVGEHYEPWYEFKKDTVSVLVKNSNNHIHGKQLEAYSFTPKKPFYNTYAFKGGLFVLGIFIGIISIK